MLGCNQLNYPLGGNGVRAYAGSKPIVAVERNTAIFAIYHNNASEMEEATIGRSIIINLILYYGAMNHTAISSVMSTRVLVGKVYFLDGPFLVHFAYNSV